MSENLNVEESAKAIMEFCGEQLKQMGIRAYVCFAEIDKNIFAVGKSSMIFDLELIRLIFTKHKITPHIIKGENFDDVKEKLKKEIETIVNEIESK